MHQHIHSLGFIGLSPRSVQVPSSASLESRSIVSNAFSSLLSRIENDNLPSALVDPQKDAREDSSEDLDFFFLANQNFTR